MWADGFFAWFTSNQAVSVTSLANNTNDSIRVLDTASSEPMGIQLQVNFAGLTTKVQLTSNGANSRVKGATYVVDQNSSVVPAINQGTIVKSAAGQLTFTEVAASAGESALIKKWNGSAWVNSTQADRYLLNEAEVPIYLAASDQLRIATTLTDCTLGGQSANPDYSAGTRVLLGTATITATANGQVSYTYAAATGSAFDATTYVGFYYSVTPKDDTGTGDYTADDDSTAAVDESVYGTLTTYLSAS